MRSRLLPFLALFTFAAGAATTEAGKAYVPLAINEEIDGIQYDTRLWVSNVGGVPASFTTRFIPTGTDGTPPENPTAQEITVSAGGTFFLPGIAPEGQVGTVEVDAEDGLIVVSRIVGQFAGVDQVGATMVPASSRTVNAAGSVVHLQGIERELTRTRTDLTLLNVASQAASCQISVFRVDSTQIQQTAIVGVPAFGQRHFPDAMAILQELSIEHGRFRITCDQAFTAFATTFDELTAGVNAITASATPDLVTDGGGGPDPVECPDNSTCFSFPGNFFTPTQGAPTRGIDLPVPAGSYRHIHLRMDVFHGGWKNPPSGLHNIFWFVQDRNFNLVGYVNFRGPGQDSILVRHGIGLTATAKPRIELPFVAIPGETYTFDYTYDTQARRITLIVFNRGVEVARLLGTPNVNRVNVPEGEGFVIGLSFEPGSNPNEPPTFGWRYENLSVEFTP